MLILISTMRHTGSSLDENTITPEGEDTNEPIQTAYRVDELS